MNRKSKLWKGLSSTSALILAILIGFSDAATKNTGFVNIYLGIEGGSSTGADGEYKYKTDYTADGKPSDEGLKALLADEDIFTSDVVEEGAVLLKNNGALPLAESERAVSLFGKASADPIYRYSAAGGSIDSNRLVSYKDAMVSAGFRINTVLYDAYAASPTARAVSSTQEKSDIGEEKKEFYTSSIKDSFSANNDVAIVMLSRGGGEGVDAIRKDSEGISLLALHQSEKDMLDVIYSSGQFKKIIVLINSAYPMELDWLDEYHVDACLWIGLPGLNGFNGVPELLTGNANPSGKLVDTYAANSMSSPAMMNFGDYTFEGSDAKYVVETEGIYTGYKYYETRYEDSVLNRYNASSSKGVYASSGSQWNYADEVTFPYGYGLSYSTFQQEIILDSLKYDEASDSFTIQVKVTNTGEYSGKSVVELYAQVPYTEYDRTNMVEKSAVQLVGFAKTGELSNSGENSSEIVTITVDRYLLASYDGNLSKHYILEGGNYYFAIGDDAHDALNNILSRKIIDEGIEDSSDLVDHFGNVVSGNTDKCVMYVIGNEGEVDDSTYKNSKYTGNEVTNAFTDRNAIDINSFYEENVATYLSRQDWDSTYPETVSLTMNDKIKEALVGKTYVKSDNAKKVEDFTQGKSNNLKFIDMVGVSYDDPQWDLFIDQLTIEDMSSILTDQGGNAAVETVGKPASKNVDGPDGVNQKYKYGDKVASTCYPSEIVFASAWSTDLMSKFGYYYAEDMLYTGAHQTWGPGANLHRTPFSGRNFEYYSEDAIYSYLISIPQIQSMVEKGVQVGIKHFSANDQETNRSGIATFMTEQRFRQECLKAFEGAVSKGGATGLMSAYNRIGCINTALSKPLLTTVLRDEWGFLGYTITDASGGENDETPTVECVLAGTDMFCIGSRHKAMQEAITMNDDGDLVEALREVNHRYYYTMAHNLLVNGLTEDTTVSVEKPWWQITFNVLIITFMLITLGLTILFIKSTYISNREVIKGRKKGDRL